MTKKHWEKAKSWQYANKKYKNGASDSLIVILNNKTTSKINEKMGF